MQKNVFKHGMDMDQSLEENTVLSYKDLKKNNEPVIDFNDIGSDDRTAKKQPIPKIGWRNMSKLIKNDQTYEIFRMIGRWPNPDLI